MNKSKSVSNIFLVGYMGCGKTSVGRKLALKTGLQFVDTDILIEDAMKMTIPQLFESKGEQFFREKEHTLIQALCGGKNQVIATGGGLPCYCNNLELMKKCGVTVYIKMPAPALATRLHNKANSRPLLKGKTKDELTGFIQKHLEEREPCYSKADITVQGIDLKNHLDELVKMILKHQS